MELDASQLYADKTWVELQLQLGAQEKKTLLLATQEYCNSLAIPELVCVLEKLSNGTLLQWGGNKALLLQADFGQYEYHCMLTLNQLGGACVASSYKYWLGDLAFAVNHSPEARRRQVIDTLQNIEQIDYFFLVDKVSDTVAEYLLNELKQLAAGAEC